MAWDMSEKPSIPEGIPHVCICCPHQSSVSLEWVQSTWGPLQWIPQRDFVKSFRISRGILNLDTHRNFLAKIALEDKTVTHLLWLDSDILAESPPDPNQALRMLLACNIPIVSGLYRAKKSKGDYPYAMWIRNPHGEGYVAIQSWTGNFIKVDVVGFGFILIRREVFEKIPEPWFVWNKQTSEDFEFCEKLVNFGYEVKVFTDVKLSHIGTTKVKIDGSVHVLDV